MEFKAKIGTKEQIENEIKILNSKLMKDGETIISVAEYSNYLKSSENELAHKDLNQSLSKKNKITATI